MKHFTCLLLCLALCCGLFACGAAEPEPTTAEPTTLEAESTTEEITTEAPTTEEATTVFVPLSGEENGVKWRTLDLDDEKNAQLKQWISNYAEDLEVSWMRKNPKEFPMGTEKTLVLKSMNPYPDQIVLRDNKSARETVLLENRTDFEALWFYKPLDERYFLYGWDGCVELNSIAIYDTKELKTIPIEEERVRPCMVADGMLYLTEEDSVDHPFSGKMRLLAYDLDAMRRNGKPIGIDLLADIPHKVIALWSYKLTEDQHYYIVSGGNGLHIFDLPAKKLVLYLPQTSFGDTYPQFRMTVLHDKNTLYWCSDWLNYELENLIIEITLP